MQSGNEKRHQRIELQPHLKAARKLALTDSFVAVNGQLVIPSHLEIPNARSPDSLVL